MDSGRPLTQADLDVLQATAGECLERLGIRAQNVCGDDDCLPGAHAVQALLLLHCAALALAARVGEQFDFPPAVAARFIEDHAQRLVNEDFGPPPLVD